MKKISELFIGNEISTRHNEHEIFGTPTLFMTPSKELSKNNYLEVNQFHCNACHCNFTMDYYRDEIICPYCGKKHSIKATMIADKPMRHLPYKMRLILVESKYTLQIRIYYSAFSISQDIYNDKRRFFIKEIYKFDINQQSIEWLKYEKVHSEYKLIQKEYLGNFIDYEKLMFNTALWYFSSSSNIYKGDTLSVFLKKLRKTIIKKMKYLHGYSKQILYINTDFDHKVFANLLTAIYKTKYWNNINVKFDKQYLDWKKEYIDRYQIINLDKKIFDIYKDKQDYLTAILKAFSIPNKKNVRKGFKFEDISALQTIYSLYDERLSDNLLQFYHQNRNINLDTVCKFINIFKKHIYPDLQLSVIIKKRYEITDILRLWKEADKITKESFFKAKVPFKKLHDWLSIEVTKQDDRECIFDIPEYIKRRFNMFMMNHQFKTSCIDKYSKLKYVASNLKNCSAGYKKLINENLQLVVISDDTGKPKALLELKQMQIVQAKLYRNEPVYKDHIINNVVLNFAEKTQLKICTNDIRIPCLNVIKKIV